MTRDGGWRRDIYSEKSKTRSRERLYVVSMMNFSCCEKPRQRIVKDLAPHSSPTLGRMSWEPRQSLTSSEFRKQANRRALERIPKDLYWKVAGFSFVVGACMELFMIKTGFYEKVTAIEAERREALSEPPAWVQELQKQHKAATEKKK